MRQIIFNRPRTKSSWKNVIALSLFLVLALCAFLFPNVFRSGAHTISRPLWAIAGFTHGSFSGTLQFFRFKSALISENTDLKNQVTTLQLRQIDYDVISKENADLKNLSNFTTHANRIVSRILSKPPRSPYDTLVIDVGSNRDIAIGNNVYLSDTVIVGTVASVTGDSSVVSMFSTSGHKQEATDSRTGSSFELVGKGGGNFQLEVPKETDIQVGDTFLHPTQSASVLGNVYYIDESSQSSFKTVYVRIPGNVFSSQWVFVENGQ